MTNLSEISFNNLVAATDPSTVSAPELSASNVGIGDPNSQVEQYIEVTADAMSRLYSGLFMIRQSYKETMHLPETLGLMTIAIKENLLKPLSTQFPIFAEFEFTLTETGSIVGENDVANTILNALQQIAMAPVDDSPEVPEYRQVEEDIAFTNANDFDEEDYEDEWEEY